MKKAPSVLILTILVLLAFGNTLNNDFVGDSQSLFHRNSFYKGPANLKRLFQKDFIMNAGQFGVAVDKEQSSSGCISYRPVTALTFFADYALWEENPAGHHLTSVLLHLAVVLLVFFLAVNLLGAVFPAFLTALVFGLHPVQSEAVSYIGYRSDLLTALFFLFAFLSARRYLSPGPTAGEPANRRQNSAWLFGSYVAFFLALLAKETALTFPLILFIYDILFLKKSATPIVRFLKERARVYAGFLLAAVVYLYLYLVVFPSAHYPRVFSLGVQPAAHLITISKIFLTYLKAILIPFTVHILPPLYAPAVTPQDTLLPFFVAGIVIVSLGAALSQRRTRPGITFCMAWFFITFLPASYIVPLPNPMAFRFLYLPMTGAALLIATALSALIAYTQRRWPRYSAAKVISILLTAIFVSTTVPNNSFLKNNFSVCYEMLKHYPDSSRPHWILGMSFFEQGRYDKARFHFEKYLAAPPRNPFSPDPENNFILLQAIGRCYVDDPDRAIAHFERVLKLQPDFVPVHLDLAKAYMLKKDFEKALPYALAAVRLDDKILLSYIYAVHCLAETGDFEPAHLLLTKAQAMAEDDPNVRYVEAFLKNKQGHATGAVSPAKP